MLQPYLDQRNRRVRHGANGQARSRQELWEKGATSGNRLDLVSIAKNCDANSLLVKARPSGPTCHTGNASCFYRELDPARDLPE